MSRKMLRKMSRKVCALFALSRFAFSERRPLFPLSLSGFAFSFLAFLVITPHNIIIDTILCGDTLRFQASSVSSREQKSYTQESYTQEEVEIFVTQEELKVVRM